MPFTFAKSAPFLASAASVINAVSATTAAAAAATSVDVSAATTAVVPGIAVSVVAASRSCRGRLRSHLPPLRPSLLRPSPRHGHILSVRAIFVAYVAAQSPSWSRQGWGRTRTAPGMFLICPPFSPPTDFIPPHKAMPYHLFHFP